MYRRMGQKKCKNKTQSWTFRKNISS